MSNGHFLGSNHCNDNQTCNLGTGVMYAGVSGRHDPRALHDDVQGACALYPGTPGGVGWPCTGNGNLHERDLRESDREWLLQPDLRPSASPATPATRIRKTQRRWSASRDDGLNHGLCETCHRLSERMRERGRLV